MALAEDWSHGSAHLPSAAPGAALYPWELTSSLPLSKGGVGLVHVPTQIQALHAKVISRLQEPEKLAWKVFQLYHLSQVSQIQPLGQHPVQQRDRPVANASPAVSLNPRCVMVCWPVMQLMLGRAATEAKAKCRIWTRKARDLLTLSWLQVVAQNRAMLLSRAA